MSSSRADADMDEQEQVLDISNPTVITYYRLASDITNAALNLAASLCVPGAVIGQVCAQVDAFIQGETAKLFVKQKKKAKGIAFPTCISVNNVVGHFSPAPSDATALNAGDLVKIDLGVHADGFPVIAAQTFVIGHDAANPITGRQADVIAAAYVAADAAVRLLKPGNKSTDIPRIAGKVAESFQCHLVEGVLSHEMSQNVIDGEKVMLLRPSHDQHSEEFEIPPNSVFCIDIVMSTGEGKTREVDARPTVYKRLNSGYSLKMKASRTLFSQINDKCGDFAFALRAFDDEAQARLGISEIVKHNLAHSYPVLYERDGEFVAQVKFTALVQPNGPLVVTPFAPPALQSVHSVDDEVKAVLAQAVSLKKKKKKSGAKKAAAASSMDTD
nr:proliferation-associated protein 2G4 [Seculamonas ecuadoriensis]